MYIKIFCFFIFIIFVSAQTQTQQTNQEQQPTVIKQQEIQIQSPQNNNEQVQVKQEKKEEQQNVNVETPPIVLSEQLTGQPNIGSGSTQPQNPQSLQPKTIEPIVIQPIISSTEPSQPNQEQNTPQIEPQQVQGQQIYQPNSGHQQQGNMENINQPSRNPSDASGANYEAADPERSARYRAQQQRLRQIREKQRQINYTEEDRRISKTQDTKNKERREARELRQTIKTRIPTQRAMFQIDHSIEQFTLDPISQMQVYLTANIYTLENNAYGVIKDIQNSKALQIYVYEDDNRIVAQSEFYFEKTIRFNVRGRSRYTIRFYNQGVAKLVIFSYPTMLEQKHLKDIYSKEKSQQHLYKTQYLGYRIREVTEKLRMNSMMDKTNNEIMINSMRKYSGYQFIEMLVVVIIAGFQVHLIKKLFQNDSIL